jgi:hypothetical protein
VLHQRELPPECGARNLLEGFHAVYTVGSSTKYNSPPTAGVEHSSIWVCLVSPATPLPL